MGSVCALQISRIRILLLIQLEDPGETKGFWYLYLLGNTGPFFVLRFKTSSIL